MSNPRIISKTDRLSSHVGGDKLFVYKISLFSDHTDLKNLSLVSKTLFNGVSVNFYIQEGKKAIAEYKGDNLIPAIPSRVKKVLMTINGLYALGKKLITVREAVHHTENRLEMLLTKQGIEALEKKLFTTKLIMSLACDGRATSLLSESGIKALEEKLITSEQVRDLPFDGRANTLLSSDGVRALKLGLITYDYVRNLPMRNDTCDKLKIRIATVLQLHDASENHINRP